MDTMNRETSKDRGTGDDQIHIERPMTDEEFIAEFERITGSSAVVKALELATLCATKKSFTAEKPTLERLNFSKTKFTKCARIGRDKRIDLIRNQLPETAGYSVLYAMTQLTEEQWEHGFSAKIITPKSSRSDIDAFRTTGVQKTKATRKQSAPSFATVRSSQPVSNEDKELFRANLISLCEGTGFVAGFSEADPSDEK